MASCRHQYSPASGGGVRIIDPPELGSLRVGGDRAAWYRDALTDLPSRYPAVKSVILFHASDDQTVTAQKVEWTFRDDDEVATAVRDAIRSWDRP